ncbi:MAG: hypothetical protein ACR2NR_18570 [Solirubrobacteraceae bacterium]
MNTGATTTNPATTTTTPTAPAATTTPTTPAATTTPTTTTSPTTTCPTTTASSTTSSSSTPTTATPTTATPTTTTAPTPTTTTPTTPTPTTPTSTTPACGTPLPPGTNSGGGKVGLLMIALRQARLAGPGGQLQPLLAAEEHRGSQIPSSDVTVTQGAQSGTQAGRAICAKPLYGGAEQSSFASDDAGDLQGKYQQWFNTGSIYGAYTLAPQDTGPPTTTSFTAATYTGTITVTNGTRLFRKVTGTGTLACTTTDSTHYTCTEKLKLVQTVPVVVKTKTKTKH